LLRCAYRLRERPEEDEDPPEDRPLLPDEDRGGGDERTVRPLDPLLREEGAERTVRPLDPLLREEGDERTVRPLDPLLPREEGVEPTVRPLDPLLREEGVEPTVRPLDPVLRVVVARRVSRTAPVDLPVPERLPCTVDDLPERAERSPATVEVPRVFPAETLPALPTSRIPLPPISPAYPSRPLEPRPIVAPRGPHSPPLERIAPG
jgi:hypothetical protein